MNMHRLTPEEWLKLALEWARVRWCWDDAPHITEMRDEDPLALATRPDLYIDERADDSGLEDPTAPWMRGTSTDGVDPWGENSHINMLRGDIERMWKASK